MKRLRLWIWGLAAGCVVAAPLPAFAKDKNKDENEKKNREEEVQGRHRTAAKKSSDGRKANRDGRRSQPRNRSGRDGGKEKDRNKESRDRNRNRERDNHRDYHKSRPRDYSHRTYRGSSGPFIGVTIGPAFSPRLWPADNSSLEAAVQMRLRRAGYYRGRIDGIIGPASRSAIRRFQADHGLRPTGAIDRATLARLGLL